MTIEEALMVQAKAIQVNGMEKRNQSLTGTLPTAFVFTYGHTGEIEISVHENGWKSKTREDRRFEFYFDRPLDQKYYEEYVAYMDSLLYKNSPVPDQSNGAKENKSSL